MHPSSSSCDQPETSVLRLRLMDAILRADTTLLVRLAGVLQETGLVQPLGDAPGAPGRRQRGAPVLTLKTPVVW
jgi:hypothetical protein